MPRTNLGRMPRLPLLSVPLAALLALSAVGPALAGPATDPGSGHSSSTDPGASAFGRGHLHSHGPDGLELYRGPRAGSTVVAEVVDDTLSSDTWTANTLLPVVATDQPDRYPGLSQVHLVYLHGAEVKQPRTNLLPMFESDARDAQAFLERRYGRSVRFDERVLQGVPRLDITTVKSRYRTSQLGTSQQFDLVKKELARVFPDSDSPRKKYVAWLDAPSTYCGQGELYGDWHRDKDNWNDLRTTGVVYRPSDPSRPADGGFCRGRTLLHELGHNLGALYGGAPNAFDGAHCNDDKNDAMCYQGEVTAGMDSGAQLGSFGEFDYRNDDYWDAGAQVGSLNAGTPASGAHLQHLNWWGVNLSRFVCRPSTVGGAPECGSSATHIASPDEFRYHSGAETSPPPATVPTG